MAQKIQTLFIDDIDGGEAEGIVLFGFDGMEYEIDLSVKMLTPCGRRWRGTSMPLVGHLARLLDGQA